MKEKKYLIIPANTDLNRGDQALIWETIRLAKEAGKVGQYYMIRGEESIKQSEKEGVIGVSPILAHPSRVYKNKKNNSYNIALKLKWGSIAIYDLITSSIFLNKFTRKVAKKIISEEKKQTLKIFEESESLFVKGGGFLHTYGGIESTYIMYFFLYHILLAQSMGKKVYIMPNSFGPFEGFLVKPLLKYVLKKCEIVCARESISSNMIKSQLDYKVKTYPDLGFFLKKDINNKNRINIEQINEIKKLGKKCVAITVRPYRFPKSSNPKEKYNTYLQSFRDLVEWLNNNKYYPIFVEHTLSVCTNENDATSINDIVQGISTEKYSIISNTEFNCRELKGIYAECDYVIGTRFHSVIFAMSEGVPAIAITYGGNKGQGIMRDMNLEEMVIAIEDVSSQSLINAIKNAENNREEIVNKINKYNIVALQRREELIECISN